MSKSIQQIIVQINPAVSSDSSLADAASGLSHGGNQTFQIATWSTAGDWQGAFLDWCTRWHWDPVNLKGYLMCKEAESAGSPTYKLFVYTASSNSFAKPFDSRSLPGGGTGTGHGYDNSALDPATGDFYFLPLYAENVIKYDGAGGWTVATGNVTGSTGQASSVRGISWHPNLYGTGDGGLIQQRNSVRAWRKSTGVSGLWPAIGSTPYSSITEGCGVYCSALNQQIVSMGTAGNETFRVTPGTSPVAISTGSTSPYLMPVKCTSNADSGDTNMARLMPTPGGSVCILESASPGRVWRLNTSTYAWELQGFSHPLRYNNSAWPTMFISTYGIYWALREENGGNSRPNSILWRPPLLATSGVTF